MTSTVPDELPIFPLAGVLLLPRGLLPLNIFEPRYLAMVDHALKTHRQIGMIQPREDGTLHEVGCAGRITAFEETGDGRYLITLTGVSRFRHSSELPQIEGFRRVKTDTQGFALDTEPTGCLSVNRPYMTRLLETYFDLQGLSCNWDMIQDATDERLITCLSMVCPFSPQEKQALLETPTCHGRAQLFMTLLELAVQAQDTDSTSRH
jgi:Lon protease-like protein